ncbi:hypothetical protein NKH18_27320 [Streptomyces sp. M10(2022)]
MITTSRTLLGKTLLNRALLPSGDAGTAESRATRPVPRSPFAGARRGPGADGRRVAARGAEQFPEPLPGTGHSLGEPADRRGERSATARTAPGPELAVAVGLLAQVLHASSFAMPSPTTRRAPTAARTAAGSPGPRPVSALCSSRPGMRQHGPASSQW